MTGHPSTARTATRESRPPHLRRIQDLAIGLMTVGMGALSLTGPDIGRGLGWCAVIVTAGLGLAWVLRRMPTAAGTLVLAGFGTTVTVSATAVAVPHLVITGASSTAVAASVAASGGLLAVGCAAVVLVRAVPGWRRLLLVPIVIAVGYGLCLPLGLAVYATHAPRTALASVSPADRDLTYQEASFTSADGVSLSGWYIPATNRAAVVLLPGSGSTRTAVLDHAVVLARHGYGVLMVDPRGQGTSEGQAMEFGWFGESDVAAAVGFLQRQPGVEPGRIAAVGLSMGGEEAIGALAADPRIQAVVAEGATNRVAADKAWLADAYGLRGHVQLAVDGVTYGLADVMTDAPQPISLGDAVAAAAPRAVLLIAGGGTEDEVAADTAIRARSPDTVQLWVVPGAAHTAGLAVAPVEWESRVIGFLGDALS